MEKGYIGPAAALRKLKAARGMPQTVYLYGATGYGKTELVRQFLSGQSYTWLSCGDLPWEDGAVLSQGPGTAAGKQPRRVVVIDGLHQLKGEEQRQKITDWARRQDLWLILISRSPIPPWLMPSYIKDGFIVITEEDLRLGQAEIAGYLKACGIACTEEDARHLERTSEGNAYAIRHAALKLKEGKTLGPAMYEEIWEAFAVYLENFVLSGLDSDLLEFLMQVSVVEEFTLELAEMITGSTYVVSLLEQAAEAGNFLSQKNGVYRLRPAMARALQNRAAKVYGLERVKDFKYNAALYYEMYDEILPALRLFEECGRVESIKSLLVRNARKNPGNGHYYELRRYYFNLEEQEIESSPVLTAGMSMLCSMLMDGEKSEYWYGKLKDFAKRARGGALREARSRLAYLDIALPHRGSRDLLGVIKNIPAMLFDNGIHFPEFSVTSNLPSTMNGGKDFCHWSPDDTRIATAFGPLVERVLGRYGKGLVKAALGESYYEKGRDSYQVITLLTRAQMETERGGVQEIAFAAVGVRVRLAAVRGDIQAAGELLDSFEQSVREDGTLQLLPNIQALKCRLALYEGNMDAAEKWMETAPDEDKEFFSIERYRYLTKVRCYLAKGEYLTAQALLEKLRYYAEQTNRPYVRMETGLLSAIVKERTGGEWREELRAVLGEAEKYRFLRLVSEEGAAVWPLLRQEKKALSGAGELDKDWLRRLLDDTEEMARRYPLYLKKRTATAADFGETALTILQLQADGLSVNQIAQRLEMKPFTVSYHIKENYRKLNASRKADALLAARSLGIL